jgi:putative FmdB family regulatory protein
MPTYAYLCGKCGKEFGVIMSIREHESTKVACPMCHSEEVKQQLTSFTIKGPIKGGRKLKLEKYVKK